MPPPVAIDYSQILFDPQGKPYWLRVDGSKVYLPPLAAMQSGNPRAVAWARSMGVSQAPDGQVLNESAPGPSYLKERGHWNPETGEWEQDTNWNNIVSTAVGAGIGGGIANAVTAPGAAAASQAPLASSTIPNAHLAVPGAIASQGASVGLSAPTFAGGGSGLVNTLKQFATDPKNLASLAALIPSIAGQFGGGGGNSANADGLLGDARDALAMQKGRMQQTQPAFDTLIRMAYGNSPIRHRGDAPTGYQAGTPYPYAPPRFGGR